MQLVDEPVVGRSSDERVETVSASRARTRTAYIVNQYPQPSHSFIRREIRALEALGYDVRRFSVRRWNGKLVDPNDLEENRRTIALLEQGPAAIAWSVAAAATAPRRFWAALRQAWNWGRRSDRGRLLNLVYFVEACILLRLLRRERIEHLHAHFGTNSTSVAMLCRLLGGPTFSFTVHGPEEFDKPEFLHLGDKIGCAAFTAAISQFGRSQLLRQCAYEQWSKVRVVRCGVDAEFHAAEPTPPVTEPRLVCIARLHEQKGLPILIDAAAKLVDRGLKFHLQIIGDGPLRSVVEARIADLGLQDTVELAGWKSGAEVRDALLASRAMVLPSFAEGLPVVIMEALALHRPVVSTYVAGIPELVEDGVCGKLVPAGSVPALADAMEAVLRASSEQLAAWGAEGARRTHEQHNAATEAAYLARLIESAAAGH
ncbi:MAG: colanic acid biosynthesis glycosyltransferase WcaL [Pirellula sp.]|nr:colanic acid biosynthesis glycosyltransferase WcaL [Pirellula sp.]